MYTIIGGDGKEYGPISGEDLRKWIAEGRLNAQSQAKSESDAAFRTLATFPEFADLLAPRAPAPGGLPPLSSDDGRETAAQAVKIPAIALIVVASLGIAYYVFNCIIISINGGASFQQPVPQDMPPAMQSFVEAMNRGAHGPLAFIISLIIVAMNSFVLFGAIKMMRLQNYGIAIAAAIIAMLPCQCCCLFGLPFGIWALVVLNKPEVKSQFK